MSLSAHLSAPGANGLRAQGGHLRGRRAGGPRCVGRGHFFKAQRGLHEKGLETLYAEPRPLQRCLR